MTHAQQVADLETALAEVLAAAAAAQAQDEAARLAVVDSLQEHDSEVHGIVTKSRTGQCQGQCQGQ